MTQVFEISGGIETIASFELNGFVYTLENDDGFYVQKFEYDSDTDNISDDCLFERDNNGDITTTCA